MDKLTNNIIKKMIDKAQDTIESAYEYYNDFKHDKRLIDFINTESYVSECQVIITILSEFVSENNIDIKNEKIRVNSIIDRKSKLFSEISAKRYEVSNCKI